MTMAGRTIAEQRPPGARRDRAVTAGLALIGIAVVAGTAALAGAAAAAAAAAAAIALLAAQAMRLGRAGDDRRALLRAALGRARDAVIITEAAAPGDGARILYVNDAFTRMTGYEAAEVIGRTPQLLQGPNTDRATLDRLTAALERRQSLRVELINYRKDGAEYWVEIDLTPVTDAAGRLTHVIAVERETTLSHRDEEALIRARAEAERAGRFKAQFLATMTHEMRTPLNGIIGSAALLLETPLAPEQRDLAAALKESGEFLRQLVDDVLDFATIETRNLALNAVEFDLREAAGSVIERLKPRALRKGLVLSLAVDAAVPDRLVGDPDRFRQVLFSLASNGVKFTEEGGVEVTLSLSRQDESCAVIAVAVRDTGIGIAAEAVPLLFREFVQLDGTISRRFGGSGLGLAISNRLVGLMGGSIMVESTPGKGSIFRFTVALAPPRAAAAAPAGAAPAESARRLLLAEDDDTNRLIATTVLSRLGFAVEIARNGREALERAREGGYALVLMDVMMPEMDGLQATRAIRALPPPAGAVPILALTANTDLAGACAAVGMNGFVAKPFTPAGLGSAIERALGGAPPAPLSPGAGLAFDQARAQLLADEIGAAAAGELVEVFLGDATERMRGFVGSERRALERAAHSIKSSAATFGFERFAAVARRLESAAATAPEAELLALIDAAADALERGRSAWREAV